MSKLPYTAYTYLPALVNLPYTHVHGIKSKFVEDAKRRCMVSHSQHIAAGRPHHAVLLLVTI